MPIEDALDRAGRELQAKYDQDPIPRRELVAAAAKFADCAASSVIPSDHAYNLVNRDPVSRAGPMFLREGRGLYRYVGLGYPYTGDIFWKPEGKKERVVGRSKNGDEECFHDPRS
jgi:hypothetical protein